MRTHRVYIKEKLQQGSTLSLPSKTSHYLSKVLRLKPGDEVRLFNAGDGEFPAIIGNISKNSVEVSLDAVLASPQVPALEINLALGISRGDRMDYGVQKSTELGVSSITPLFTEFGEVKLKADRAENKLRHWRKIAVSASEQSGRLDVPELAAPCRFDQWISNSPEGLNIMLEPDGGQSLKQEFSGKRINLVVGPEGGFSPAEIKQAEQQGFVIASMGNRILRTETAPVASLAILQHLYGDM
jgi:16S rRNA (uracil1498-N3)-methyltransferase